jgi:hypothetical protein
MTIRILTGFLTEGDPEHPPRPTGFYPMAATPYVPGRTWSTDPVSDREFAMREWLAHVEAGRIG